MTKKVTSSIFSYIKLIINNIDYLNKKLLDTRY